MGVEPLNPPARSSAAITGNRRTPYPQVLEVLGMKPGESIFRADLWSAQNRLSRLDWIASAEIHRRRGGIN